MGGRDKNASDMTDRNVTKQNVTDRPATDQHGTDQEWEDRWRRYGFLEMISDMRQVFPKQRVMQMFGWMVMFGATGWQTKDQMVKRLVILGFSRSSVYDAAADIRRFQDFLRVKWGREVSREELAKKVQQVQSELADYAV